MEYLTSFSLSAELAEEAMEQREFIGFTEDGEGYTEADVEKYESEAEDAEKERVTGEDD